MPGASQGGDYEDGDGISTPVDRALRRYRVRVLRLAFGLTLVAAVIGVVYLAGSPSRDVPTEVACEGLPGYVRALLVQPDGLTVSACTSDGSLTLWEPASGRSATYRAGS